MDEKRPVRELHPFWMGVGACAAKALGSNDLRQCTQHPQAVPSLKLAAELIDIVNTRCADAGDDGPLVILVAAALAGSALACVHASDNLACRFTREEFSLMVVHQLMAYRGLHYPLFQEATKWRSVPGLGMEEAVFDTEAWNARGEHRRTGGARRT